MELVTLSFAESTAVCLIVKDAFETGQEAPKDCGFDDTLTGNEYLEIFCNVQETAKGIHGGFGGN